MTGLFLKSRDLTFAALTRAAVEFFRAGMLLTRANSVAAITARMFRYARGRFAHEAKAVDAPDFRLYFSFESY